MSKNTQTVQSSPWVEEFRNRVKAFAAAAHLTETVVLDILKNDFGVDEQQADCLTILDSDEFLPASDLFKAFVDSKLARIARVRMGIPHLRGRTHLDEPKATTNGDANVEQPTGGVVDVLKELVNQNRPLESWSIEELLEKYDEAHPEVTKRLSMITHGRPCIILNREQGEIKVNIAESAKLVRVAMKQPTSDRALVKGKTVVVYRVGTEFPVEPIDESPFFPGMALVNGFCGRSGTDWNGVDTEARVLARIYVQHVETAQLSKKQMKEVCEDARKGADHFRDEYPEASIKYDEMKAKDTLPRLKISPKDAKQEVTGRRDNGF